MQSESEVLERKLSRAMGRALGDFSMISEGDRILVAVSGGKGGVEVSSKIGHVERANTKELIRGLSKRRAC